jgi:chromate transport protein ChrA
MWAICAAIVFASAWMFDHLKNAALQNLVGGIAIVACVVIVVCHFKMYAQYQKEETDDDGNN